MSSKKSKKKAAFYEKLQILRAATNSSAINETSIIVDASRYIEDLKAKVEKLNQETESSSSSQAVTDSSLPVVRVETLEKGFLISVFSEENYPGLLVSVLAAFDELGLDVLDARVSCEDNFQFQAVGEENEEHGGCIDAETVKEVVFQAISNLS